ncbi:trypsin-like serine protease [Arsenicicoccus dermatophilus]|uniref:trypsin-like serine protease n=1 Tax=Arsenicicoccus dermatophilus TaxID=1076331 RepID=UPI001F4CC84D|nr:trypsin-like serine protease [Arsenicicoccus dermatophilus]MCH8613976.1 trypsin-like serine protease [Arsenicicoccus dermatophilus]
MRPTTVSAALAAAAVLAGGLAGAAPASAAQGGGRLPANPGVVALLDGAGNHVCSGVLVAPRWVLTDEGSMPCLGASKVTGDITREAVNVTERKIPFPVKGWKGNDPTKSGAMLLHLDKPVKRVKPVALSDAHPKKGEKLDVVAFNGPEGINHTLSVGKSSVTAKNHNGWASYYGKPSSFTLEGPIDNGSLVMRDDKVVGFVQVANPRGFNAEDIAHIHAWITKTAGLKK